jgi:DNA-binding transcriptional ArsR family regulator
MPDSLRQFKAEIFQALAHPTWIAILDQLREGELAVGAFVERLGLEQASAVRREDQPAELLSQAEVLNEVGRENILPNVDEALRRAREISSSFNGVGMEIADDMQAMAI